MTTKILQNLIYLLDLSKMNTQPNTDHSKAFEKIARYS